jgi:hypothetical protein
MGWRLEIEEVFVGAKAGKAEESWVRPYDGVLAAGLDSAALQESRRALNTFLRAATRSRSRIARMDLLGFANLAKGLADKSFPVPTSSIFSFNTGQLA